MLPQLESKASDPHDEFDNIAAVVAEILNRPVRRSALLEGADDIDLQEMLDRQANALVKRIINRGESGVLYAESRAGKSFVALDLGWHLAQGKAWHGLKVTRAPVLYVALEGVDGFRKRMLAIQAVRGRAPWFKRIRPHVSLARDRGDHQAGSQGVASIVAAAAELAADCGEPVGLIIVDTFARAMAGDDENSTADVMQFVEHRAGSIAKATGAAVLTLAHTNRAGDLRGSLHLRNSADVVLRVERDGDRRTLVGEKCKDDAEGVLFDFELKQVQLGEDADGEDLVSCVIAATPPKPRTKDSKAQRRFRAAYELALSRSPDGRALATEVRRAFVASVAVGEEDAAKARQTKASAWYRAVRDMPTDLKSEGEYIVPANATSPVTEFEVISEPGEVRTVH